MLFTHTSTVRKTRILYTQQQLNFNIDHCRTWIENSIERVLKKEWLTDIIFATGYHRRPLVSSVRVSRSRCRERSLKICCRANFLPSLVSPSLFYSHLRYFAILLIGVLFWNDDMVCLVFLCFVFYIILFTKYITSIFYTFWYINALISWQFYWLITRQV